MASINGLGPKAIVNTGGGNEPGSSDAKERLEAAMTDLQSKMDETSEHTDASSKASAELLVAKMQALLDLIKYGAAATSALDGAGEYYDDLLNQAIGSENWAEGWNGAIVNIDDDGSNNETVNYLQDNREEFGAYDYSFSVESSSETVPLAFRVGNNDSKIIGTTYGGDVIITIEDTDGKKRSYILRGFASQNIPIIIVGNDTESRYQMDHGITVDFRNLMFYGDQGSIDNPRTIIVGTKWDDVIYGSQAADKIIGGAECAEAVKLDKGDLIMGNAGDDSIWGDDAEGYGSDHAGGNDIMDGGSGNDTYDGGGGIDHAYMSSNSMDIKNENVENTWSSDKKPKDYGFGDESNGMIDLTGSGHEYDPETGVIKPNLHHDGGSTIEINMPDNFDMCYGTRATDRTLDLILTFVSYELDDNGRPKSFSLRIKDFFRTGSIGKVGRLVLKGNEASNVIDFSAVRDDEEGGTGLGGAIVQIHGLGGNDVIFEPTNDVSEAGVDIEDLRNSSDVNFYDDDSGLMDEILPDSVTANENWEIEENEDGYGYYDLNYKGTDIENDGLVLQGPSGYEKAFAYQDDDNNIFIVFVNENPGESAETLVVKINRPNGVSMRTLYDMITLRKWGSTGGDPVDDGVAENTSPILATVLGKIWGTGEDGDIVDYQGWMTDGGEDHDTVEGPAYGSKHKEVEREMVYEPDLIDETQQTGGTGNTEEVEETEETEE